MVDPGKGWVCQCGGHAFDPWSQKIAHAATKPALLNYWASALETGNGNHWSPHAWELMLSDKKSQHNQRVAPACQKKKKEKSPSNDEDIAQPKINK